MSYPSWGEDERFSNSCYFQNDISPAFDSTDQVFFVFVKIDCI